MRLTRKAGLLNNEKIYKWKAYTCTVETTNITFKSDRLIGTAYVNDQGYFELKNTQNAPQTTTSNLNKDILATSSTFDCYHITDCVWLPSVDRVSCYPATKYELGSSPQISEFSDTSPDTYPENGYTTVNGTGYWFVRQN